MVGRGGLVAGVVGTKKADRSDDVQEIGGGIGQTDVQAFDLALYLGLLLTELCDDERVCHPTITADRAYLALSSRSGIPALTTDREWLDMSAAASVQLVCVR